MLSFMTIGRRFVSGRKNYTRAEMTKRKTIDLRTLQLNAASGLNLYNSRCRKKVVNHSSTGRSSLKSSRCCHQVSFIPIYRSEGYIDYLGNCTIV